MKTITIIMPDALYENFKECYEYNKAHQDLEWITPVGSVEDMILIMAEGNIANTNPFHDDVNKTRIAIGKRKDPT